MPSFDIVKKSSPGDSFRVKSIVGKFDLQSASAVERFTGEITLPKKWSIGLVVGKSGSGKTTIAKELFPKAYITNFKYKEKSILDDMPKKCTVEQISKAFNSVGFSSPPSWLKPYQVLSNGEKMRVDLVRAILSESTLFVFDEFTSVVDRQVARIGSFAIQKAVRKINKQFIAVTCHYDVEDWLLPDWKLNTDTMTFSLLEGQKKNRPALNFKIYETKDRSHWNMFARYHYLSHSHSKSARIFVATIDDQIAAFHSIIHWPHPRVRNFKQAHRVVVLPDYQGLGIGIRLVRAVAEIVLRENNRYIITTSAPPMIHAFRSMPEMKLKRYGRVKKASKKSALANTTHYQSINRITTSWEYVK